jgi:hypothetical protein
MTRWDAIGYLAACLVFAAFGMKEMIPLRLVALCSNLAFIIYALGLELTPVWLLHAGLLPLNGWRLWQAVRSSREMTRLDLAERREHRPQASPFHDCAPIRSVRELRR